MNMRHYPNRVGQEAPVGAGAAPPNGCMSIQDQVLRSCDPYNGRPQCRIRPLPLPRFTIAPNSESAEQTIRSRYRFVGYRLFVDSSVATFLEFRNFSVEAVDQRATALPMMAFAFSEVSQDSIWAMDPLEGSEQLTFTVFNHDNVEHIFAGLIIGVTTASPYNP